METLAEKEARIDAGETFDAKRKRGEITLAPPARGEGEKPQDDAYPYTAKSLKGLRGTETLPHTTIERNGFKMRVPIMPDRKTEREFAAKYGFRRS